MCIYRFVVLRFSYFTEPPRQKQLLHSLMTPQMAATAGAEAGTQALGPFSAASAGTLTGS